jgi:hypothetical protein
MRDCESKEDAIKKCGSLLPQYPDENTTYMESWEVLRVSHAYKVDEPQVLGP